MAKSVPIFAIVVLFGAATLCTAKYTQQEKSALTKFRPMVKSILQEDYMDTDQYLIPWLRTKKLNLQEAKEMLSNAMEWRKENNMSTILSEDFTMMEREFPIYHDGVDKDGRPLTIYLSGRLDFRKIAISGGMDRWLHRYINRNFEKTAKRIRDFNNPNVTETLTIFDLTLFNRRQHLCLQCIGVYVYFTRTYEAYFPQMNYKVYFVNMPSIFEQVTAALRPVFSEHTKNSVYFYGHDKAEWRRELLKQIPNTELYRQFGGTKIAV